VFRLTFFIDTVTFNMAGRVMKNFFDFTCKTLRGKSVEFNQYKGKVVLVENVASL